MIKQGVKNSIKEVRLEKGLTQEELAKSINSTRQTIIAIEKQRYEPTIGTVLKLATTLNTPVEDLFRLENETKDK